MQQFARTVIALEPDEIQELQMIVMDDDQEGALEFLRKVVDPRVQAVWNDTEAHGRLFLEYREGGKPGQGLGRDEEKSE